MKLQPAAISLFDMINSCFFKCSVICLSLLEWCSAYAASRPDPEKLQTSVDTFMKEYDKEKEKVKPLVVKWSGLLCKM